MKFARASHWVLARIGVFQGIGLALWLSERARRENEPPIHPWIVYSHIAIGFIASTGISVRCLSHLSTFLLIGSQLHMTWIFAMEPKLGYNRCLRARFSLRCLQTAGIYLRMLGLTRNEIMPLSKTYVLGLTLQSISSALLGFLCFPANILRVDYQTQITEYLSSWSLLTHFRPFLGICLALGFLIPSLIYATFQMNVQSLESFKSSGKRLLFYSDLSNALCILTSALVRDCNISYWLAQGSDFWLQALVLLQDVTILLGLTIEHDLAGAILQNKSASKRRSVNTT